MFEGEDCGYRKQAAVMQRLESGNCGCVHRKSSPPANFSGVLSSLACLLVPRSMQLQGATVMVNRDPSGGFDHR